jgi:hypothetical protein
MATIATILIGVISLLGKQNELMREVLWRLVVGREHLMFFPTKKARNERWEVVVMPPIFLLIPMVHRQLLSLPHPNVPHV